MDDWKSADKTRASNRPLERDFGTSRLLRIVQYSEKPMAIHHGLRLWDITRTDMGIIGGAQHYRETIDMDLPLEFIDGETTPDGLYRVRLRCPPNIPNLAIKGKTANVIDATCDAGIITVLLTSMREPIFEIDFDALITEPFSAQVSGHIGGSGKEDPVPKAACNIDYIGITSSLVSGRTE